MINKKYTVILAMLVLAIFAVGSVSAADNVTADIDVPTEDIAVDDVSVDYAVESDDGTDASNKVVQTRASANIPVGSTSSYINTKINEVSTNGGGTVSFAYGNYTDIAITLKNNVQLIGNGAKLIGTGTNHVITVTGCSNFTITGFEIDTNYNSTSVSAIRGSNVENGIINNNTIYNGFNAINIFQHYNNMTVSGNIIHDTVQDAISFANPMTRVDNNINNLNNTLITGNIIYDAGFGIFIGGNFKGIIYDNSITNSSYGIQFKGKPDGHIGNIIALISDNNIGNVDIGIELINTTIIDLVIDSNTIITNDPSNDYVILGEESVSKASGGNIEVTDNYLYGCTNQDFYDMADIFDNYEDGDIV